MHSLNGRRRSGRGLRRRALAATTAAAVAAVILSSAGVPASASGEERRQPRPVGDKTTWRLGSFVLPPAPLGTAHVNRPSVELRKPCADCYVTGLVPRLVYADGSRADMSTGVMLHHFGLYDPAGPDPAGQKCAYGRPAFGAGDERAPWLVTPAGFGLPMKPGPWTGFVEIMNHSDEPREVFLEADVYSVPASTPGMGDVTPVLLSVGAACSGMEYKAPAGRSATSMTWTSTMTGRVVWGIGHVHPGGIGVVLDNLSTGRRICASEAGYGGADKALAGMVTSMSTCSWDRLGAVRKGDKLRIISLYDSPHALSDAMGIMSIGIHETRDLDAGSRAPASMRRTPDTKVPAAVAHASHRPGRGGGHGH